MTPNERGETMIITDEWETPEAFFRYANARWGPFTLDAAANAKNTKCKEYLSDALNSRWVFDAEDRVWCNPPYSGSHIPQFLSKAAWEIGIADNHRVGRVVMLLPASTGTEWFHIYGPLADSYLLRRRLSFSNPHKPGKDHPRYENLVMVFPGSGGIARLDWEAHQL